jgi:Glycosyl transferase family 2
MIESCERENSVRSAIAGQKNDTIAIVGTFRASLSDTIRHVNYHLNTGIDHLFLFFDDPTDPAIDALAEYKQVTCFRCDDQYWIKSGFTVPASAINQKQVINANVGLRLAREMGIDWITHIDSDELLYVEEGIATALSRIAPHVEVISFQILEAVPEQLECECVFEQVRFFKSTHSRRNRIYFKLAKCLGCKSAFYHHEYFRGHQCKTALRTCANIKSMGIHEPVRDEERPFEIVRTLNIKLLHYDACALTKWIKKWSRRLDGTIISPGLRPNRKLQRDEIDQAFRQGEGKTIELYKKLHFVTRRQQIVLRSLGLLKSIRIKKSLFATRATTPAIASTI